MPQNHQTFPTFTLKNLKNLTFPSTLPQKIYKPYKPYKPRYPHIHKPSYSVLSYRGDLLYRGFYVIGEILVIGVLNARDILGFFVIPRAAPQKTAVYQSFNSLRIKNPIAKIPIITHKIISTFDPFLV
jgi:hypothetical protein